MRDSTGCPGPSPGFSSLVGSLRDRYSALWNSSSAPTPDFPEPVTGEEQSRKEEELERLISQATSAARNLAGQDDGHSFHQIKNALRNSLFQSQSPLTGIFDEKTREKFSQSTDDFIGRARLFNPSMSVEEIYQALRNVWIVNSIQLYLDRDIVMTPSCYAYSMLYPYTDNILDAPDIDKQTKRRLNRDFSLRLAGLAIPETHPLERDIFRLFEIIEEEYDRADYPQVFDSLLAIQKAQTRSVRQFDADETFVMGELLDISVEKGGTSVLADGYLAAGNLTYEEADFLFGYGVLLQILDDLQDFEDDLRDHQITLVGATSGNRCLDEITDTLLVFTDRALAHASRPGIPAQGGLGELIGRSCRTMIFESIACHQGYYTPGYIMMMEKYSPVSFEFLRQLKKQTRMLKSNLAEPGLLGLPDPHEETRRKATVAPAVAL